MPILEMCGLRKTYRMGAVDVAALAGVSFAVEPGEFVAITGPSGSGKSTLLNLIGCLDTPSHGTYRLNGRDVSDLDDDSLSDVRRDCIGFVFQSFHLIPRLSVLENVELPLFYAGVETQERRERARNMAQRVGLAARVGHRPVELSGGERQRVAIARALVNDPVLILADEPTGNLDTATGDQIMQLLLEIWRGGATLVMVTHDPDIAASAPRNVHLRDGRIEWDRCRDATSETPRQSEEAR